MILVIVVTALAILALITQAGVSALQRAYPARGSMVEVTGARLNIVDIGPRDAAGPPVVMIHGASSNLEVMRQPLGEMLAKNHRVILIDRPGHGWSTRERDEDSTPAIQAGMIAEALQKLGIGSAQPRITPDQIESLIAERNAAKKRRDFKRSDQIRLQLADSGIILEDTKDGSVRWKYK